MKVTVRPTSSGPGKWSNGTAKYVYSTVLISSALLAIPYYAIYYSLAPSRRPRPTWSLSEAMLIIFLHRSGRMTDQFLSHGVRDPQKEPRASGLKETVFRWITRLREESWKGEIVDDKVEPPERVGTFVWGRMGEQRASLKRKRGKVGIYFHGGGYSHFSAHEDSQTSKIPRRLIKMDAFSEIHAVEYRLLPSPSPAALQDAIAVYDHLTHVDKVAPEDLVLIGDSAGGNIALALATWLRDEGFAAPGGLLLLSPWCDPAAECPPTGPPTIRPNASSDYLCDSPRARAYLVSRFIGSHSVTSPYISPASHGTFGGFPRTFVHYGGAERLERECDLLVRRMGEQGVELDVMKSPDTPHDVLMLQWWNGETREGVYRRIEEWVG